MVAAATVPGMTHISFRPTVPTTKILERPQKVPDTRLLTGVPVNRFLRPAGSVAVTSLPCSTLASEPALSTSQSVPLDTTAGAAPQSRADNTAQASAKKNLESSSSLVGEPQVRLANSALQASSTGQESVIVSVQGPAAQVAPKSPAGSGMQGGTTEGKQGQVADPGTPVTASEIDALKAMEWSDGIASLPGSNLKVSLSAVI